MGAAGVMLLAAGLSMDAFAVSVCKGLSLGKIRLKDMFDGTWDRKSTELFVARYLEKHYSKNEIIALYVNVINYGNNYTGIYEASYGYFDTDPEDLTIAQASLLAGIPQSLFIN